MTRTVVLAIGLACLLGTTAARAEDEVEVAPAAIVAARKAGNDLMLAMMGDIKSTLEMGMGDVKAFKKNAEAIVAWEKAFVQLFPKGTEKNTRALPTVWSDRAGFEKASAALVAAAGTLAKAAEAGDTAAFTTAFQATGDACGACHRTYRAK